MSYTVYPSLRNKRVVVTGGGSSIGAAIVESFAQQGAHVAFLDIAEAESRELERRLADRATRPRYYACDLTDVAAIRALFPHIREQLGPIDVLINNAANDDRHLSRTRRLPTGTSASRSICGTISSAHRQ